MRLARPHRRNLTTWLGGASAPRVQSRLSEQGSPRHRGGHTGGIPERIPLAELADRLPIILFELDRQGCYTRCEGGGLALMGSRPGRVLGQSIFELYAELPELARAVRMALGGVETNRSIEVHGRLHEVTFLPRRDASGAIDGLIGISHDVTDLRGTAAELASSERQLRASEARFRSLITNMRDIIFSHGGEGDSAHGYDDTGPAIFGADAHRLAGTIDEHGRPCLDTWYNAIHPDDRAAYLAAERRRKAHHEGYTLEYRINHPVTGELRWMREVAWVARDDALGRTSLDSYILDITDQKNIEIALTESRERYRTLIEAAPVAILIYAGERCVYANPRAVRLLRGSRPEDVQGRNLLDLFPAGEAAELRARLASLVGGADGMAAREVTLIRLDGERVAAEASAVAVLERGGPAIQLVLVDLSERKRAEALHHLAQYDSLTGLPNRALLMERLGQAVAAAKRGATSFGLMLLDLDRFKAVNDEFGHAAGDDLLRQVAKRMRRVIREVDTLARLGGDEFVLLQAHIGEPEAMTLVASRIVEAMAAPFRIDRQEIRAGVSIGIASCPQDGTTIDALLRQADLALYRAKEQGRGRFCFFEPGLDAAMEARRQLAEELRLALERDELHLIYQPQVDLVSRRVVGVGALLCWRRPGRGLVAPSEFIPVAEATGLIRPLGDWALDRACAQARTWRDAGLELRVAVNISAVHLRRPDYAAHVASVLRAHGLPAAQLCLELTETVLTDPRLEDLATVLDGLAGIGVSLTIENFGLGNSSLLNLRRLPVQQLKIDFVLIDEIDRDADCEAIVRATIGLGHSLGKRVMAEGVETEAQHALLAALGCDQGQGFLYARPDRAEALRPYLEVHAQAPLNRSSTERC